VTIFLSNGTRHDSKNPREKLLQILVLCSTSIEMIDEK